MVGGQDPDTFAAAQKATSSCICASRVVLIVVVVALKLGGLRSFLEVSCGYQSPDGLVATSKAAKGFQVARLRNVDLNFLREGRERHFEDR